MRVVLYSDAMTKRCVDDLPRRVGASKIMRYVLKAIMTNDAEWEEYRKTDKDAINVRNYLREKLLPRL